MITIYFKEMKVGRMPFGNISPALALQTHRLCLQKLEVPEAKRSRTHKSMFGWSALCLNILLNHCEVQLQTAKGSEHILTALTFHLLPIPAGSMY